MIIWVGYVKITVFKLENNNITVTDEDKILALMIGLNNIYDFEIFNSFRHA